MVIPQLPMEDPIALQCESFLAALRRGRGSQGEPRSAETRLAVNIAAVLEGLQDSIAAEGAEMPIAPPARQPGNLVMLTRH